MAVLFDLFAQPGPIDDDSVALDSEAFEAMMQSMKLGLPQSRIKQLFEHLDGDGVGTCSDKAGCP